MTSDTSADGTERSGDLERFAVDRALRAAWVSEFWSPADQEYGFVDYFEATAARNLLLLAGLQEIGEDMDRRGIVPQSDGEQARLVTDGGTEQSGLLEDDRHYASFDRHRNYRYTLTRKWDESKPTLGWIMLNPSTADETDDDPTIRRCVGFAKDWGYGSITVGNLFALRATDPDELREHHDPVGDKNDDDLRAVCEFADKVIAAWGANGDLEGRGREVGQMLDADLYALDTTKDGHPVHPLYQPSDTEPEPWNVRCLHTDTEQEVRADD